MTVYFPRPGFDEEDCDFGGEVLRATGIASSLAARN